MICISVPHDSLSVDVFRCTSHWPDSSNIVEVKFICHCLLTRCLSVRSFVLTRPDLCTLPFLAVECCVQSAAPPRCTPTSRSGNDRGDQMWFQSALLPRGSQRAHSPASLCHVFNPSISHVSLQPTFLAPCARPRPNLPEITDLRPEPLSSLVDEPDIQCHRQNWPG